jgi:DNA-binding LacI/PurR family transcriptional regulator
MAKKAGGQHPISIKDVAKAVGVSHPTVSRALQGSPLVHPETARQIREKAEEMGYKASAVARSLVTRKTWTIGLVVAAISDPFYGEIVSGVEEVASRNGYSVILANAPIDPEREVGVVRSLQERRVDGILVTASRAGERYIAISSEMSIPIVLINNQHDGQFVHSVSIDNLHGARQAIEHLIALGHRRIGYIGNQQGYRSDRERYAAYRRTLSKARLPFQPELVAYGNGLPDGCLSAVNQLLSLPEPPTAIFCYNDMSCLGAIRVAADRGLRIPEDLSLVGFDDLFFAPYLQPALTTVCQPRQFMGQRAMEILLALLAGESIEKKERVEGQLIIRSSTAAPSAENGHSVPASI